MEVWIIAGLVVLGVATLVFLNWYLIQLPEKAARLGITTPKDIAKFRDSVSKGPIQLLGGSAVLLTFVWTVTSGGITLHQTAVQSANQQFIDASKLAASRSEALSAAGNYAFAKLGLAYPDYCPTITNILTNQIATYTSKLDPYKTVVGRPAPHAPGNIAAAVTVLGSTPLCVSSLQLADGYMAGASFSPSQSFRGAHLENAWLFGSYLGWGNFNSAKFDGAHMAEEGAVGGSTELSQRQQTDSNWKNDRYHFIVNFEHASLRNASFLNTSLAGAVFEEADLYCVDFSNSEISRTDFSGAKELKSVVLTNACFDPKQPPTGLGQSQINSILSKRKDCATSTMPATQTPCR